jgi:hypothetical protein
MTLLRARLAVVVLIASVVGGIPGPWPQALARAPITTRGGDVWRIHPAAGPSLSTAALRTSTATGRLTRGALAFLHSGHIDLQRPVASGAAQTLHEGSPSSLRVSPSPARAPPISFL